MTKKPEVRERILQFLRAGHPYGLAAAKAGIHRTTLHAWRKADKEFDQECDIAEAQGIADVEWVMHSRAIDRSDPNSFQAAKMILERRRPTRDDYAPVSHNHPFLAIQNNYLNPLAQIAPTLMKQIEQQPIEGEIVNEQ
jgi:hypothetical protein